MRAMWPKLLKNDVGNAPMQSMDFIVVCRAHSASSRKDSNNKGGGNDGGN